MAGNLPGLNWQLPLKRWSKSDGGQTLAMQVRRPLLDAHIQGLPTIMSVAAGHDLQ
jgi:hypothetical protein